MANVTSRQYMEAMKTAQKSAPQKSTIFFKLFCYVHPENVPNDSLEASFIFEQVRQPFPWTVGVSSLALSGGPVLVPG